MCFKKYIILFSYIFYGPPPPKNCKKVEFDRFTCCYQFVTKKFWFSSLTVLHRVIKQNHVFYHFSKKSSLSVLHRVTKGFIKNLIFSKNVEFSRIKSSKLTPFSFPIFYRLLFKNLSLTDVIRVTKGVWTDVTKYS